MICVTSCIGELDAKLFIWRVVLHSCTVAQGLGEGGGGYPGTDRGHSSQIEPGDILGIKARRVLSQTGFDHMASMTQRAK